MEYSQALVCLDSIQITSFTQTSCIIMFTIWDNCTFDELFCTVVIIHWIMWKIQRNMSLDQGISDGLLKKKTKG